MQEAISPPIPHEVSPLALPQIDRGRSQRESTWFSMPVMVSHYLPVSMCFRPGLRYF
jgi:hypothetical protein